MSQTEHKSLQGTVEASGVGPAETKDIAGPTAPEAEQEPTVRVKVINYFRDEAGSLFTPEEEVTLPESYARTLGPVYVKPVE